MSNNDDDDDELALSRINPRVRVRVSVSIVLGLASGGYSWIWPMNSLSKLRNIAFETSLHVIPSVDIRHCVLFTFSTIALRNFSDIDLRPDPKSSHNP